ncbi:hypothetical protein EDB19DRAFT_1833337 [Suillus lakei]|nr:hypothetical protein EDB19DRAFT_1833337 [Suillus lakei]
MNTWVKTFRKPSGRGEDGLSQGDYAVWHSRFIATAPFPLLSTLNLSWLTLWLVADFWKPTLRLRPAKPTWDHPHKYLPSEESHFYWAVLGTLVLVTHVYENLPLLSDVLAWRSSSNRMLGVGLMQYGLLTVWEQDLDVILPCGPDVAESYQVEFKLV